MTHKEYVVGFLFSKDLSMVVLILKNKPDWQKGLYNGIGGKVEEGETFDHAMIREFEEETGVYIADWDLFARGINDTTTVNFYRAASDDIKFVRSMTDERIVTFLLRNNSNLPHNIIPNIQWLMPLALDSTTEYVDFYIKNEVDSIWWTE